MRFHERFYFLSCYSFIFCVFFLTHLSLVSLTFPLTLTPTIQYISCCSYMTHHYKKVKYCLHKKLHTKCL
jgi:hypothetical protein